MGQLYILRYEAWSAISKFEFDKTWNIGLEAFAKTGNWGGVEKGIRHLGAYGTAWGGYVLFEAQSPEAFAQYQMFHFTNLSHVARITIEPVIDIDAAFASTVAELRSKAKAR